MAWAEGQVVRPGQQKPLPPFSLDIAAIQPDRKAVDNREFVASLARKGGRCVALRIADVMGPSVVGLEEQALGGLMIKFDLHRLVILKTEILGRVEDSPVLERRPWVDYGTRNIGLSTGSDLVQVDRNVQAVGVHADVTHSQCRVGVQFALQRNVPLRGLRIAIARIGCLAEGCAAYLGQLAWRKSLRKLKQGLTVRADPILKRVLVGFGIALVVVLKLPKARHGKYAKACTEHGLVERAVGDTNAWIDAAFIELAKARGQSCLAVGHDGSAG